VHEPPPRRRGSPARLTSMGGKSVAPRTVHLLGPPKGKKGGPQPRGPGSTAPFVREEGKGRKERQHGAERRHTSEARPDSLGRALRVEKGARSTETLTSGTRHCLPFPFRGRGKRKEKKKHTGLTHPTRVVNIHLLGRRSKKERKKGRGRLLLFLKREARSGSGATRGGKRRQTRAPPGAPPG